ncbi:MAG: hypothetical protein JSV60_04410 [Desulfobacterales bacterium]|nr:MAG: hypothetical protein JSV60_04410 [Desulfobacterales bacterium]
MERKKKCCVVGIGILFMLFLVASTIGIADDRTKTEARNGGTYIVAQEDAGESSESIRRDDSEYEEGEGAMEDFQKAPGETEEESSSEWPSEEEPLADSDAEES